MHLEVLIIREVQIIRPRALGTILDCPNIRPTTTIPLRQKIPKVRAQPRVYPEPTAAFSALNAKVMGT